MMIDHATRERINALLYRVEQRLRRNAKGRKRPMLKIAYREAAERLHKVRVR